MTADDCRQTILSSNSLGYNPADRKQQTTLSDKVRTTITHLGLLGSYSSSSSLIQKNNCPPRELVRILSSSDCWEGWRLLSCVWENLGQYRWTCGLKRRSAALRSLESGFRSSMMEQMIISCVVFCVGSGFLRRAHHSFRGVLPGICVCVSMSVSVCDKET